MLCFAGCSSVLCHVAVCREQHPTSVAHCRHIAVLCHVAVCREQHHTSVARCRHIAVLCHVAVCSEWHHMSCFLQDALLCLAMSQLHIGKHSRQQAADNAVRTAQKAFHNRPGTRFSPVQPLLVILSSVTSPRHPLLIILSSSSSPLHPLLCILSSATSPLHHLLCNLSSASSALHPLFCMLQQQFQLVPALLSTLPKWIFKNM